MLVQIRSLAERDESDSAWIRQSRNVEARGKNRGSLSPKVPLQAENL